MNLQLSKYRHHRSLYRALRQTEFCRDFAVGPPSRGQLRHLLLPHGQKLAPFLSAGSGQTFPSLFQPFCKPPNRLYRRSVTFHHYSHFHQRGQFPAVFGERQNHSVCQSHVQPIFKSSERLALPAHCVLSSSQINFCINDKQHMPGIKFLT